MKRSADGDCKDTGDLGGEATGCVVPSLLKSTCHANTTKTKYMALLDTFQLIILNEISVTMADSMLRLIASMLGDHVKVWWPLSLAELETKLDFKGLFELYSSEHFRATCGKRFDLQLKPEQYLSHLDEECSKYGCAGKRFAKVRNGVQEVTRVVPLEQCFFYKVEQLLERIERDPEFKHILLQETTKRRVVMGLRASGYFRTAF
jgi:hypothetical protein